MALTSAPATGAPVRIGDAPANPPGVLEDDHPGRAVPGRDLQSRETGQGESRGRDDQGEGPVVRQRLELEAAVAVGPAQPLAKPVHVAQDGTERTHGRHQLQARTRDGMALPVLDDAVEADPGNQPDQELVPDAAAGKVHEGIVQRIPPG